MFDPSRALSVAAMEENARATNAQGGAAVCKESPVSALLNLY